MTDGRDSSSPGSSRPDDSAANLVASPAVPDAASPVSQVSPAPGDRSAASENGARGTGDVDPAAVQRKLLMGLALILAVASVYVGVFNWPKPLQMVLAGGATIALVSALRRPVGEPPRRPK